jgi:carbonic anhydrase
MRDLKNLLDNNRAWREQILKEDPDFFDKLAHQQSPEYLWIGCSDSRVPANQITGLMPGEVFVHRNVANQVVHTDLNCLSVIQYAVDVLKVKHIIVCGHFGCGGVQAVLNGLEMGLIDNWLRHVRDVYEKHDKAVDALAGSKRVDRLCALNVIEQVSNVCYTTIVKNAWKRGQELSVHGWVYDVTDGLIRDLKMRIEAPEDIPTRYKDALASLA